MWKISRRVFHQVPGLAIGERLLHRVGQRPPALGLGVGGHRRHVGLEVVADVFEVGEQVRPVAEDRVVPDVRAADLLEDARPRLRVEPLVVVDPVGPDVDPLAEPPHGHRAAPAAPAATPAAATSAWIARHSSPSGNRYRASDSGRISAL